MNFIEAKEKKKELDKRVDLASKTLNTKYKEKTALEFEKISDQYKKDLLEYNEAFNLLRSFSKYYNKEYKREINKKNKVGYRYG